MTPRLSFAPRLLLGPGPSPVSDRVREALALPTLGHLDSQFLRIMDEVNEGLRTLFGTRNPLTFPISGTGSAGMEAAFVNLLMPGDRAIIGVNGIFGERMVEMARRLGAEVIRVDAPWGEPIDPDAMIEALHAHPDARVLAIVHAETSTGIHQPLEAIGKAVAGTDTLFVVDAVTSLGGVPVEVDGWGIDAGWSGTQKCLGVPPGLAPITFSEKAVERFTSGRGGNRSWYLDVSLIAGYIGTERSYHHTAPINLVYALHEALSMIGEEGMDACFDRHRRVARHLSEGLAARGFSFFAREGFRLPQLTSVSLPGGRVEAPLRKRLAEDHGIEVGGGLGPAKGRIWRIGMMGSGARIENADLLLTAIDELLPEGVG